MTPIKFSLITVLCATLAVPALAHMKGKDGKMRPDPMTWQFSQFDTNGDGKISKEDRKGALAKNFKEIDADGNRSLSKAEAQAGMKSRIEKIYEERLAEARKGTDSAVVAQEVAKLESQRAEALAGSDARVEQLFAVMDRNENGTLEMREMRGARGMLKMIVKRFDTNDDGSVSPAEFEAGKENFAKRMEDRRKGGHGKGWWGHGDGQDEKPAS